MSQQPVYNLDPYKHMVATDHRIGGVFAKLCRMPVGYHFQQHRHSFEHMSVLASGIADVEVNGVTTRHEGPVVLNIEAKKVHTVTPVTPCVWLCIHSTHASNGDTEMDFVLDDEELYE